MMKSMRMAAFWGVTALVIFQLSGGVSGAQDSSPVNPGKGLPKAAGVSKTPDEGIIKKGETLSLAQCIDIAQKRQPNIIAAMNTVDAARSRVGQAQANYFPQVSVSGGYSRISPVGGLSGSAGGGSFDQYTSSAQLTQNIYDFGKTSTQVSIQRFNVDATRSDLENVTEQIVFNVKQAYYSLLQAKKNRDVAAETVGQFEQHLEQAKGFYEVGTKPRFDVTKAEVDLSNAKLNLIRAGNAVKIAAVNLNNAIGVPDAPDYTIVDDLAFRKYGMTFDAALAKAFSNRPDIQALAARRKVSEQTVELAKKNYYPTVTGDAAYNWGGSKFPLNEGWNVGATVSMPVFSGFLTKHQVGEAKSNLDVVRANEELLRQNVLLDVQQSYLNLQEAENRVPTSELAVRQATENLEIANGRYAAGVGSPIEVTDAQVAYSNAKTAYIQALSDYKVAQSSLERAMGGK